MRTLRHGDPPRVLLAGANLHGFLEGEWKEEEVDVCPVVDVSRM